MERGDKPQSTRREIGPPCDWTIPANAVKRIRCPMHDGRRHQALAESAKETPMLTGPDEKIPACEECQTRESSLTVWIDSCGPDTWLLCVPCFTHKREKDAFWASLICGCQAHSQWMPQAKKKETKKKETKKKM